MNDKTRIASSPFCLSKQTPHDWGYDLLVRLDTRGIISLHTVEKKHGHFCGQLQLGTGSQKEKNKDVILYWKVTSEIDMPDFNRESDFLWSSSASCVSVLVVRLLSAARSTSGRWKRCIKKVWCGPRRGDMPNTLPKTPLPQSSSTSQLTSEEIVQEKTCQSLN